MIKCISFLFDEKGIGRNKHTKKYTSLVTKDPFFSQVSTTDMFVAFNSLEQVPIH